MAIDLSSISGLILAGGLGRRMSSAGQSTDKGLTLFKDKTMVAHVIERLAPQLSGSLLINCNQNALAYQTIAPAGSTMVPDQIEGFAGPLAGLEAGLTAAMLIDGNEWLVTAPCDTPFLPLNLVEQFVYHANAKQVDLLVARDKTQVHPVFMMVHQSVLPNLRAYLASGERKVDRWYCALKHTAVTFEDAHAFSNINTPLELKRLE